jgi:hypothetical protein
MSAAPISEAARSGNSIAEPSAAIAGFNRKALSRARLPTMPQSQHIRQSQNRAGKPG